MSETSSTIERFVQLLELIGEVGSATPQEMAAQLGVSRSSVQRLLTTLQRRRFVIRTPTGFGLDTYVRVISDVALRSLRSAAYNVLREISETCQETAALYVADGDRVVVLEESFTPDHPMRVRNPAGTRSDLAESPGGLAFLAHARESTRARALRRDPERIAAAIARVRETGHAHGPVEPGSLVQELAVPVVDQRGRAVASLAILCPQSRAEGLMRHLPMLQAGAGRIVEIRRNDDENRLP